MVSRGKTILTLLLRYFARHVIEAAVLETEQCYTFFYVGGGDGFGADSGIGVLQRKQQM